MAYYHRRIFNLEQLMDHTLEGNSPNEFSFLGIIDNHISETHEVYNKRVHHELILHAGTRCRLHVQYITGYDEFNQYDIREVDDRECPFYPKGTLCFLPRLDVSYVEEDKIVCNFKGGDTLFGQIKEHDSKSEVKKPLRAIGPNRVVLLLNTQPSSIEAFLNNFEVSKIKQNIAYLNLSHCRFWKEA